MTALGAFAALGGAGCGADDQSGAPTQGDLTVGARGAEVRELHEYLSRYGYYPNEQLASNHPAWRPTVARPPADNDLFDTDTRDAVSALQQNLSLPVTGLLDAATRDAIHAPRCGVPDNVAQLDPADKFARYSSWQGRLSITWKIIENTVPASIGLNNMINISQSAVNKWQAATSATFSRQPGGPGTPNANISIQFTALGGNRPDLGSTSGATIQLDSQASWKEAGGVQDLESVVLHHLGHALGLNHSGNGFTNTGGVVMYPLLKRNNAVLYTDDEVGASSLYDTYPQLPGKAFDIGVGKDNSAWIITRTPLAGTNEFTIAKFNGTDWVSCTDFAGAKRIAVDPTGKPWVVNSAGNIFRRTTNSPTSGSFQFVGGLAAKDIAISQENGYVYAIQAGAGNQQVFKFTPKYVNGVLTDSWDVVPGSPYANRVSAGAYGGPWLVDEYGSTFRQLTYNSWEQVSGRVFDIAVGCEKVGGPATLMGIDYAWSVASSSGQVSLAAWDDQPATSVGLGAPLIKGWVTGNQWTPLGAAGTSMALAVGPNAQPWIVNNNGDIFRSAR
jgi:peptidoglycan hydrolase-like protein with peptidoglycan-binding domain